MEEQSQVEELQRSLQEQGTNAEDVSCPCPACVRTHHHLLDKYESICMGHFSRLMIGQGGHMYLQLDWECLRTSK